MQTLIINARESIDKPDPDKKGSCRDNLVLIIKVFPDNAFFCSILKVYTNAASANYKM